MIDPDNQIKNDTARSKLRDAFKISPLKIVELKDQNRILRKLYGSFLSVVSTLLFRYKCEIAVDLTVVDRQYYNALEDVREGRREFSIEIQVKAENEEPSREI